MLKIIIALAMLFFAIPTVWYVVGVFCKLWMEMFEQAKNRFRNIKEMVSYHLPTINLKHDDNTGNRLIWDSANKTMYGHPEGIEPIEE